MLTSLFLSFCSCFDKTRMFLSLPCFESCVEPMYRGRNARGEICKSLPSYEILCVQAEIDEVHVLLPFTRDRISHTRRVAYMRATSPSLQICRGCSHFKHHLRRPSSAAINYLEYNTHRQRRHRNTSRAIRAATDAFPTYDLPKTKQRLSSLLSLTSAFGKVHSRRSMGQKVREWRGEVPTAKRKKPNLKDVSTIFPPFRAWLRRREWLLSKERFVRSCGARCEEVRSRGGVVKA